MEDLLIALADLRSFPETRFLAERGIVGETWSTESAAPVLVPVSVLVLPVKEPGEGWRETEGEFVPAESEALGHDAGLGGPWVTAANPSTLRHARSCSHYGDYPAGRLSPALPNPTVRTVGRCQNWVVLLPFYNSEE